MRAKARIARDIADRFLDKVGGRNIEEIFLIGSRAAGTARHDSDWDFLIVGEGFDDVEEERGMQEWETNIEVLHRYGNVDIIFSSASPKPEQKAIKVNLETLVT